MKVGPGSRKIVIASLIIIVIGGIVAASTTGWINPKSILSKIPVIQNLTGEAGQKKQPIKQQADNTSAEVASLKKENQQLKEQVVELTRELSRRTTTEATGTQNVGTEDKTEVYRDLADYYSGMKPASAVAILKNLDTRLVADILKVMDKEQAGQILAAMEPAEAAKLIELIAGSGSPAGTQ